MNELSDPERFQLALYAAVRHERTLRGIITKHQRMSLNYDSYTTAIERIAGAYERLAQLALRRASELRRHAAHPEHQPLSY